MITSDEISRYKRQLLLNEVGGAGQQRIKAARVLLVGAGGLGAPMLLYLAAAGVGHITIIDDDKVALDNLHRQVAFRTRDVGALKALSARDAAAELNPHVTVEPLPFRLTPANALDIVSVHDIVADGSDNFRTRYLVNDACFFARKPLVFAALGPFDGYLSTFRAFETGPDGNPMPSYRCLFPEAPEEGAVANCQEAGILGPVAGVMGTLQAMEVLKEILGIGQSLAGRLLIYDALSARFQTIALKWSPDNPLNGRNPTIRSLADAVQAA